MWQQVKLYNFFFYWIGWWHQIGESCVVNMFGHYGMWVAAGLPHKSSQLKSGIAVARRWRCCQLVPDPHATPSHPIFFSLQFDAFLCCINEASLFDPIQQNPACGIISDFCQTFTFMQSFYYTMVSNICVYNVFKVFWLICAEFKECRQCLIWQTASLLHDLDSKLW